MPKRFTLAEAHAILPAVEALLRGAVEHKSAYDRAEQQIQAFKERVMLLGGVAADRQRALDDRQRRDAAAAGLKRAIEKLDEMGCQVKDLDIGLVDFATFYRGREVLLCWRMGEPEIAYWHEIEAGFAGRKPIDQDFRDHHRGE